MSNQFFSLESTPLVLGGNTLKGGFSLNFRLPDIEAMTNQAYDFHKSNTARNFSFLQATSYQAQSYLDKQLQPVINAAMKQITINDANSQNIFDQASDLAYKHLAMTRELTEKSLNYSREISLRSIEAQRAAQAQTADSGGMCFITTAVCEYMNLPDDCEELQILRKFRDEYLLKDEELKKYVDEYYSLAPGIKTALEKHPYKDDVYSNMLVLIKGAVLAAKNSDYELCIDLYCMLVQYAITTCTEMGGA